MTILKKAPLKSLAFKSLLLAALPTGVGLAIGAAGSITWARPAKPDPAKAIVPAGAAMLKAGKYKDAAAYFKKASENHPGSATLQYYLGMSHIYNSQTAEAELPLSRAVVLTTDNTPVHKQAADMLLKYRRIQPYSCMQKCLRPPKSARWNRKQMPLMIYVSDGKMLPKVFDDALLSKEELNAVGNWAKNPSFVGRLSSSQLYRPEYKSAITDGFKQWQWAINERVIDYRFTADATKADILVFWCNELRGLDGWTYLPLSKAGDVHPAVIMMSLQRAQGPTQPIYKERISVVAAHELGHALGLEHSPNKADLMYYGTNDTGIPSNGDRATVRALYSASTDYVFPLTSKQ
ncbi:MAG: matrixin family metalloprotease [Cyanobacteriota/Melainabacteria group bacterium]